MATEIKVTPEIVEKEVESYEEKLALVEAVGGVATAAREALAAFDAMVAQVEKTATDIAKLRPGVDYEAQAELLAAKQATEIITLQALASDVKEQVDAARLAAFTDRIRLLLPFQAAVLQADQAALDALKAFAAAMPAVRQAYQAGSQAQRVMHIIGKELAPLEAPGEGRAAPPFARGGDPNPGPVASWIELYVSHFLKLAPAPGSAEQDLSWFYSKVR